MTQNQRKLFGDALREARTNKGYTQQDCAMYCDVSVNAYQFWERGLAEPKADNMSKICEYLEIDATEYAE